MTPEELVKLPPAKRLAVLALECWPHVVALLVIAFLLWGLP